ncbi:acyltransferase family protein [Chachezhania sediminis]|uniref:acyltransferase family protein n=1 Tax=Chachezhania sediminis TaxID=2599291 RepID=UPI00131E3783|nr:acyltransferase family protein [Chachezhania sediminis]
MNVIATTRPGALAVPPGPRLALILSAVIFAFYCWYVYSGAGEALYEWTKTWAPYSVRQYLGMSKRFLWQYGHVVFLFGLLVLSRYIFLSDRSLPLSGKVMDFAVRYSSVVFLCHFPILFFLAAVTPYNKDSVIQQIALLGTTLALCIAMGQICFAVKPAFDRWQRSLLAWADRRFPRSDRVETATVPLKITRSHSEFLNYVKVLAMFCVVLGHFSFNRLSTIHIPGFDGAAPRFAVPAFFMISGYFLMMSIDRSRSGPMALSIKRGFSLYYVIVPALVMTIILDRFGIPANPQLYDFQDYYTLDTLQKPYAPWEIGAAFTSSLAYMNSSWWFAFLGVQGDHGGMRAFSNDPYWFMCYLIPFSILLIAGRLLHGPARWIAYVLWLVIYGIPILLLTPLFLSGSLAYVIHKRWGVPSSE